MDCFPRYIKLKKTPPPKKKVQKSAFCVSPFMREKREIKQTFICLFVPKETQKR